MKLPYKLPHLEFDFLRRQVVGCDSLIPTPYGSRLLTYCDYTASGRCLRFVEDYLMGLQERYANTHTEDDITGRSMTRLLHEAERSIKRAVNAGETGRIIACGTGATAAIHKLQEILGVALPPATRAMLLRMAHELEGEDFGARFEEFLGRRQPVVFVGPYEHHSNEVSWREGLATVVEVGLTPDGGVDLADLERQLQRPELQGRLRIGSFSAASNVTGRLSPVHEIAALLHEHDALACFDYAASGPYVSIDMSPADPQQGLDAIFVSPHKFLGGPGSCGILVFKDHLYDGELPPTVGGGGTVDYVGYTGHDFTADIEEREKAGTPGVLQLLKASLAFEVKQAVGVDAIEEREHELTSRALRHWAASERIEVLGHPDPSKRCAIVSFNLKDGEGRYLHPKFATRLLNDLFGVQSRAGCSCAGPYGHRLLGIDEGTSERYRAWIRKGYHGIKPGWCRVGFHYVMDDAEADYVIEAVAFVAEHGRSFLPHYRFDLEDGSWCHVEEEDDEAPLSLRAALQAERPEDCTLSVPERRQLYREAFARARELAHGLDAGEPAVPGALEGELAELQYFCLPRCCHEEAPAPGA